MNKISTADDLAAELRSLLAYVESDGSPSREKLVATLSDLADRTASGAVSEIKKQLQLDFPWSASSQGHKALERMYDDVEDYLNKIKRLSKEDPTLRDHIDAVDNAQSALLSVKVRLKAAENKLYR